MSAVRRVNFLEEPTELERLGDWPAAEAQGDRVIAMKPSVRAAMVRRGWRAESTLTDFTNASHARVLETAKPLADWLRQQGDLHDAHLGIAEAYREALVFWARLAIHYCLWSIEVSSNAIERLDPAILCASASGARPVRSLFLEPDERTLGLLVERVARHTHRGFEDLAHGQPGGQDTSAASGTARAKAVMRFLLQYHILAPSSRLTRAAAPDGGDPVVLLTTRSYQMDRLGAQLGQESRRQVRVLNGPIAPSFGMPAGLVRTFWPGQAELILRHRRTLEQLANRISEEAERFSYRGVAFGDVLAGKVRTSLADHVVGLHVWAVKLDRVLDALRPAAVVSCGNRDDEVTIAELCRAKQIPSVLVSHGSHVRPKTLPERIEWGEHGRGFLSAPFSCLALPTPLAEGYLHEFPAAGRAIKTGPLLWGAPVNRDRSQVLFRQFFGDEAAAGAPRVILHCGSPKHINGLRPHVYETGEEYVQALCDVAKAAEQLPGTVALIKFRPSREISVADVRTLVPFSDRVRLLVEEPLSDVLGLADVLVSFSSTVIEEALQNRIPVLLYGGGGRYQHVPATPVSRGAAVPPAAVYHAAAAEDLAYALERILSAYGNGLRGTHARLFDPYIYPRDTRVSLLHAFAGGSA